MADDRIKLSGNNIGAFELSNLTGWSQAMLEDYLTRQDDSELIEETINNLDGLYQIVAVTDIDAPDLTNYDGSLEPLLIVYDNVSGINDQITLYIWDESPGATNSPYVLPGKSGKWVAISGKYINSYLRINTLTSDRLLYSDVNKTISSVDALSDWIDGTINQVIVSDDGDGSITLLTPQNIHTGASPEFVGITLSGLTDGSIPYVGAGGVISENNSEMFYDVANSRIGFGTNTPTRKFHFYDNEAIGLITTTNNTKLCAFGFENTGDGNNAYHMGRDANGHFTIRHWQNNFGGGTGTTRILVYKNGLVAIGSHTPGAKLDIYSENAAIEVLRVRGMAAQTGDLASFRDNADNELVRIQSDGILNSQKGRIRGKVRITSADSPYTVPATVEVIFADTDGGAITANLPVGIEGTHYKIINCGSSGNNVVATPNGAELLFGAGAAFNITDGLSIDIDYDATEGWW